MPEPVLLAIAAAVAKKATGDLVDLVKNRFRGQTHAEAALSAAAGAAPDAPELHALAEQLHNAINADAAFGEQLHAAWHAASADQTADHDGVANAVTGDVRGTLIQARDVQGGISVSGTQ